MYDIFPLTLGFLGSLHCLGMCGPLVLAYSLHFTHGAPKDTGRHGVYLWGSASAHHLIFHAGRLLTYCLLGALAAALFRAVDVTLYFSTLKNWLSIAGGILLVVLGLALSKIIPLPSCFANLAAAASQTFLGRGMQRLISSRSLGPKVLLGMAAGTIPCCLSWAMIVTAATTLDPLKASGTMALFGLGTVPALFAAGLSASVLSYRIRSIGERIAALLVVLMGMLLIFKGARILV